MSEFINASKHKEMTAAVEAHFNSGQNYRGKPNGDSGKGMERGMTSDWDTKPIGKESGTYNSSNGGAPSGNSIFNDNVSANPLPKETGVNYKPLANAGHNLVSDKPFGGSRDGYAGNTPSSGVKMLDW